MGHENELLAFTHNESSDGMAITVFGPLKSLHPIQYHSRNMPVEVLPSQDASLQTERQIEHSLMIDREVPTRDVSLEHVRGYSRNVDVRYFKSWNYFRDRFRTNYSCSQQFCPVIRERLQQHQLDRHRSLGKSHGLTGQHQTLNKNSEYTAMRDSAAKSPDSSRHCISPKSDSNPKSVHTARTDGDDFQMPECSKTCPYTRYAADSLFSHTATNNHNNIKTNQSELGFVVKPTTNVSTNNVSDSQLSNHSDDRNRTDRNQSRCIDGCATKQSSNFIDKNAKISERLSIASYSSHQNRKAPDASSRNKFDSNHNITRTQSDNNSYSVNCNVTDRNQSRCIDGCGTKQSSNLIDEQRNDKSGHINSDSYSSHQDKNIPPSTISKKFDIIDNFGSTQSENYTDIRSRNKSRELSRSKIRPNVTNKSNGSKSESRIPVNRREESGSKRNKNRDYIQREVKEWLQDLPMLTRLDKETKVQNDNDVNRLISNLNKLASEARNLDFEQNAKKEIENCLKNLLVWYPGAKRDQEAFKNHLVDSLLKRLSVVRPKILSNIKNDSSTSRNSAVTDNFSLTSFNNHEIKDEVIQWLSSINLKTNNKSRLVNNIDQTSDFIVSRIKPIYDKPTKTKNYKLILKAAIVDVINDPSIISNYSPKNVCIGKLAEDLVNKILSIRKKNEKRSREMSLSLNKKNCYIATSNLSLRDITYREVNRCFKEAKLDCSNTIIRETAAILEELIDTPSPQRKYEIENVITNFLESTLCISEDEAFRVAKEVIIRITSIFDECTTNTTMSQTLNIPKLTRSVSIYTSEDSCCWPNPVTSTPKKKPPKKDIPKLNPQEIEYMNNVGTLIRAWMETLPETFSASDEEGFKETIIKDLAGDIMDEFKLEQLAPGTRDDREKYLKYVVYRWIIKLDVIDINEVVPHIEVFLQKLNDISVPNLTQPQHGNRQEMANIKHMVGELGWKKDFVPEGIDILEDEISIWMNEQPSDIFNNNHPCYRNIKIHELAETIEHKLRDKRTPTEVAETVARWMNSMVKPTQQREVHDLAQNLKDRVIGLPQDATLVANLEKKQKERAEYLEAKANRPKITMISKEDIEEENTMKEFIEKFIEHNYDTSDPLARGAANQLLRTHLQRLNSPARGQVYNNIENIHQDERFPTPKMMRELEYIKDISDWLKNIPVQASYNSVGNRERIEFVNNLAANIRDVEEQRENDPAAMDYNMYMASIISQFVEQLPIIEEHRNPKYFNIMIDQLIGKIIAHREIVLEKTKMNETMDSTGIYTENIGDFIEEFIRINGSDIADDGVKLEAWAIRLIREIKKMVQDSAYPSKLTKGQIYRQCTKVQKPGDETAVLFGLELEYANEISNWLKNLPLLPIDKAEKDNIIVPKVCELAEKIVEMYKIKSNSPNDTKLDAQFEEYLAKWISELPLDNSQEILLPVVTNQLMNRIEKLKQTEDSMEPSSSQRQELIENSASKCQKHINRSKSPKIGGDDSSKITDVIEKWCHSLPIKAENANATKTMKDEISVKLFKTVGELNMDPKVYYNDDLYQDLLTDKIDGIFQQFADNTKLQKNKDNLKTSIINAIVKAKNDIKETSAGDAYKQNLEDTIVISIPNPTRTNKAYDSGFEIYKDRLARIFILENFDQSSDAVKIKYEQNIKKEIDKYFEHAKDRNTVPLSNEEMYYELYGALFKVPIPNELSIINEVEELKTRCEVDAWFEELPITKSNGISDYLEWDKILSTLAKRIHEIEKFESKPDQKVLKEIMKWIVRLPLQPGQEKTIEQHAEKLLSKLKATAAQRKCVLSAKKVSKGKKDKGKVKNKTIASKRDSQIAGPSSSGKSWTSLPSQLDIEMGGTKPKAADVILDIVQNWCNQLPLCATPEQPNPQMVRDNLITKILIKISELNSDPAMFNIEGLYEKLLDEELEHLLSSVMTCKNFKESKEARKFQLKEGIMSVKPLILEEFAHHKYKEALDRTVDNVLQKPQNMTTEKDAQFAELKNNIIDDFVQYKFEKADDDCKRDYKDSVHETVSKLITGTGEKKAADNRRNSLMKTNELLCELTKISAKEVNVKGEIEEIRMKKEVSNFFKSLPLNKNLDTSRTNNLKASLAQKLNVIEIGGHSPENEDKMKHEITKCLKKLGYESKPEKIDTFISKLRNNEAARRSYYYQERENKTNVKCECMRAYKPQPRVVQTGSDNFKYESSNNEYACDAACRPMVKNESFYDKDKQTATFDVGNYQRTRQNSKDSKESLTEDSESDSDENDCETMRCTGRKAVRCSCKRQRGSRRRQFCMVPVRWYYENCHGCNPCFYRMPVPEL